MRLRLQPPKHIKRSTMLIILEILFLCVSPIAILYFGAIDIHDRLWILAAYTSFVGLIVLRSHFSMKTLGMRVDNIRKDFLPYLIFTTLGVVGLLVYAHYLEQQHIQWPQTAQLFLLFLPVSFAQEFLFRSYLMHRLRQLFKSIATVVLVNAVLFTFLHAMYADILINLPLAFVAGVAFALMYYKYPNLWLISLSHGILNFVAVYYSFFAMR